MDSGVDVSLKEGGDGVGDRGRTGRRCRRLVTKRSFILGAVFRFGFFVDPRFLVVRSLAGDFRVGRFLAGDFGTARLLGGA